MNKDGFLIAPSGKCDKKMLEDAKIFLKKIGFESKNRDDVISVYFNYAGDFKRRISEINEAYSCKETDYIFCIIGGTGAVQVINGIDYKKIKGENKTIIGSSDITIILNSIYKKTKKRCVHGPNLNQPFEEFHGKTISSLLDVLNKKNYGVLFKEENIIKKGWCNAKIIGGNLELLVRSLGTEFEVNTDNRVLFLEDVRLKEGYLLDFLWQLKLAKKFKKVRGIILGYFLNCGNNTDKILIDFFKGFNVPVIYNQPIGHKEPNISIPLGEKCLINTEKRLWKISFN